MIAIFDLDGVITGEQAYWDSAGVVLGKAFGLAPEKSSIPINLVAKVKSLAVNSNWDLAYILFCCQKIMLKRAHGSFTRPLTPDDGFDDIGLLTTLSAFDAHRGFALLSEVGLETAKCMESHSDQFTYRGLEHQRINSACQEVHESKLSDPNDHPVETSAVEISLLKAMLKELQTSGFELGIATGRTRREAGRAISQFGLETFFDPKHIVCHDDIISAEKFLERQGARISLAKPHPFSILRAANPGVSISKCLATSVRLPWEVSYIGDTVSDVLAAKAAGARSIGVMTGVPDVGDLRKQRKQELLSAGCDQVIPSVLELRSALRPSWETRSPNGNIQSL